MSTKVLCVDDDQNILAAYQRNLRKRFTIDVALGGKEALELLEKQGPYAVVVSDMQMPGMNGVEFLAKARQAAPDTVRFMLTGNADQKTAVEAVNNGHVYQFLNKPCSPEALGQALENGIRQYRLVTAERELLENTLNGSVKMLTEVLAAAQPAFFGRGQKLRDYIRQFAQSLRIAQTWDLEIAAMLSQIGFVTLPGEVMHKFSQNFGLSGAERDLVSRVPDIGSKLIAHIPRLETVARTILYQNKNYDGSGFPVDNVAGDDIPVGSRILKVLSDLLQLESTGMPRFKALQDMQSKKGLYDPRVMDTAFVCFDVYLETSTALKAASKALTCAELTVGHLLASNIETEDGILMISSGTRLSPFMLEKLRNFQQLNRIKEPIHVEV